MITFQDLNIQADLILDCPKGRLEIKGDALQDKLQMEFDQPEAFRYAIKTFRSLGFGGRRILQNWKALESLPFHLSLGIAGKEVIHLKDHSLKINFWGILPYIDTLLL